MTTLEVTNDPVRDYLNSIGRTRLLTADEEVALASGSRSACSPATAWPPAPD